MTITAFPPLEYADADGFLAMGGDLEVESLLLAYRSGIFPWPCDEEHLLWFSPPRRAILLLRNFHASRSLRKERKRLPLEFFIDRNIPAVIQSCSEIVNRGTQQGTWITPGIQKAYLNLAQAGYCHSFEAYLEGQLVGGLYGVSIGRMFAGESMFFRVANASKLVFWFMVETLQSWKVEWIDCQMITPVVQSFGAELVRREQFLKLLHQALAQPSIFQQNCRCTTSG